MITPKSYSKSASICAFRKTEKKIKIVYSLCFAHANQTPMGAYTPKLVHFFFETTDRLLTEDCLRFDDASV